MCRFELTVDSIEDAARRMRCLPDEQRYTETTSGATPERNSIVSTVANIFGEIWSILRFHRRRSVQVAVAPISVPSQRGLISRSESESPVISSSNSESESQYDRNSDIDNTPPGTPPLAQFVESTDTGMRARTPPGVNENEPLRPGVPMRRAPTRIIRRRWSGGDSYRRAY